MATACIQPLPVSWHLGLFEELLSAALAMRADSPVELHDATDDAHLVQLFLNGRDSAFDELITRYQDRVFRLISSVLGPGSEGDAEEVTQEVFLTVFRKLHTFDGRAKFGTWLYRIAHHRALDLRRRPRQARPHVGEEQLANLRDPVSSPERRAQGAQREAQLHAAIATLPEAQRTAIYLFYWQGFRVDEIAEMTDVASGTVKSNLFRARQQLANRLIEEHHD